MRWNVGLAGLALSWGLIAVLAGAVDLDASALAFLRLALAALTLALVAVLARCARLLRPGAHLRALVALGSLQAAHWWLFFETVKLGSVALAVLTFALAPVFLAVLAPVFLSEQRSRVALVAIVPGAAGVGLVAFAGNEGGSFDGIALLTGIGSAVTFAFILILSKRLLQASVEPLTVAFWDCLAGAVVIAPALLLTGRVVPIGADEWAAVLLLGVVLTGLSTLAYVGLLRHVTAQTAGILTFLEPISAVILAWALLDDPLTGVMILGGVLVVGAGVAVVVLDADGAGVTESVAGVGSAQQ